MMKKDDQLTLLGFDELSPEEAQEFARLMSEEDQAEVAFFGQLKDDLRSLKEVPPCQLSSAHLREAILRNGMRPTQRPWWTLWTWSAGLAATACFAVAALMISRYYSPDLEKAPRASSSLVVQAPTERTAEKKPVRVAVKESAPVAAEPKAVANADRIDTSRLMASTQPEPPVPSYSGRGLMKTGAAIEGAPEVMTAMSAPMNLSVESAPVIKHEPEAASVNSAPPARPDSVVVINSPSSVGPAASASEVNASASLVFGG